MARVSNQELEQEVTAEAEASYSQIDGEYKDYLEVAVRLEHKALSQDRLDVRHSIILELATASRRYGKALTRPQMYRIASFVVSEYWRKLWKPQNSLPCGKCSKRQRQKCLKYNLYSECQKVISIASLDVDIDDGEGGKIPFIETIADDNALDLAAWLDANTFLLGFPKRMALIARRKLKGKPLTKAEMMYLRRYWRREQKKLL
jgi:hypothetical protein